MREISDFHSFFSLPQKTQFPDNVKEKFRSYCTCNVYRNFILRLLRDIKSLSRRFTENLSKIYRKFMIQHTRDMFVVNVIISSLHRARTSFCTREFLLFNSQSFSLKDGRFCVYFSFSSENSFQNVCDLQHPMIANYLLSQSGFEARRTVPALCGT